MWFRVKSESEFSVLFVFEEFIFMRKWKGLQVIMLLTKSPFLFIKWNFIILVNRWKERVSVRVHITLFTYEFNQSTNVLCVMVRKKSDLVMCDLGVGGWNDLTQLEFCLTTLLNKKQSKQTYC